MAVFAWPEHLASFIVKAVERGGLVPVQIDFIAHPRVGPSFTIKKRPVDLLVSDRVAAPAFCR